MGAETEHDSASEPGERVRKTRHLLVAAWALLAGGLGGAVLWNAIAGDREAAPAPAASVSIALPGAPPASESTAPATPTPPAPARAEAPEPAPMPSPPAESTPAATAAPTQPEPAPAEPAAAAPAPGPAASSAPAPTAPAAPPTATATTQEAERPAWLRYSRPFDANDRRPRIAVVITELGLSNAATTAAIQRLPGDVTLAFSPYADGLGQWINLARAAGHEVLLDLPMEPLNFPANDPGPRTLLTSLSTQQNLSRLDWVLGRVTGYVGVTNQMGSRFTAMPEALKPVLTTLNERGLMFLDSRTTPRSVAVKIASDIGLPRAIVDRQIDQEASRAAIDGRLTDIERIARETGSAVAMGQPYPVTLERLDAWIAGLEAKGLVLSPLTAIANRQPDR